MKPARILLLLAAALLLLRGAEGRAQEGQEEKTAVRDVQAAQEAAEAKVASLTEAVQAATAEAQVAMDALTTASNAGAAAQAAYDAQKAKGAGGARAAAKLESLAKELAAAKDAVAKAAAAKDTAMTKLNALGAELSEAKIAEVPGNGPRGRELKAASDKAAVERAAAELKAAKLEEERKAVEAEVTQAANALKAAKAGGDAKAIDAAKAAMDAKIAALLQISGPAKEAAQAAEEAKKRTHELAVALENEVKEERDAGEAEARAAQAQKWFDASVAQAKKGHLIATVQVNRDGKPVAGMRYDSYPGLERVVGADGALYERAAGKGWMEVPGWGKPGAPAQEKPAADADALANADAVAEIALRALQPVAPDATEGAVAWKDMDGFGVNAFLQGREKPAKGAVYPQFGFIDNEDEHCGVLLREVEAEWKWEGQPSQVTVCYFYITQETAPPAGPLPEEQLAEILRAAKSAPLKVDAAVTNGPWPLRVAGIVAGEDFDLTVYKGEEVTRRIAVGAESWSSADGGKTWQKQAETDRRWFALAFPSASPEIRGWPLEWPFEAKDEVTTASPGVEGGGPRRRFNARLPYGHLLQVISYMVPLKDGKPGALGRYEGVIPVEAKVTGLLSVEFAAVAGKQGVLPPPGNPEAVPAAGADTMLATALKAMAAGTWQTELHINTQDQTGPESWSDLKPAGRVHGLVSGADYDFTCENAAGHVEQRRVGIGGKAWVTANGGQSWNNDTVRVDYSTVTAQSPFGEEFRKGQFEIAGTEEHDGEKWLHIRQLPGTIPFISDLQYWLLLDKNGNPVSVRRCSWTSSSGMVVAMRVSRNCDVEDFTPAKEGVKIALPEGVAAEAAK